MAVEGEILCPIREIELSIEVVFPHLINDDIHVELCVRTFLPHQLVKTDSDKETFKRNSYT